MDGVQIKQEPTDYENESDFVLSEDEPSPISIPMETPVVKVEIDEDKHDSSLEEMHEVTIEPYVKEEELDGAIMKEKSHQVEAVKVKEEPKDVDGEVEQPKDELKEEPKDELNFQHETQTTNLTSSVVSIARATGIAATTTVSSNTVLPAGCTMVLVPAQVVSQSQPQNNTIAAQNSAVATPITLTVGQATMLPPRVILPAEQHNGVEPAPAVRPLAQQNGVVAGAVQEVPWSQLWIQPTGTTSVVPATEEDKEPPRKKTRIEYNEGAADAVYTEPSTNTKGGKTRRDVQTQFPTWDFVEERSSGTQTSSTCEGVSDCGIQTNGKNDNLVCVPKGTGTTEPWPSTDEDEEPAPASKASQKKKAGGRPR